MGTTAEKLTYLNDTKQLLKENINSLGGNLTNEPFRQYASVLEGIYEQIPKVSGIGTNLSLSPTMVGKIKLNEIDGDTLQDGTPTPSSPIEIENVTGLQKINVCGKNLLPFTNQDFTLNNVRYYAQNGSLILDGTSTGETNSNNTSFKNNFAFYLDAGTYTLSQNNNVSGNVSYFFTSLTNYNTDSRIIRTNSETTSATFTLNEKTKVYLGFYVYQKTFDNVNLELMLEKGSTATTYESYTGNTYEVNLGKNLFDKNNANIVNGYFTPSSTTITADNNHRIIYIPCNSNTTYTIQKSNVGTQSRFGIGTTTSIPEAGTNVNQVARNNTATSQTITTNSTAKYLVVWCYFTGNTEITFDDLLATIQIEKGSTATSYTPYFTPIELNKIGTYEDIIYKDNDKWYIEKQTGKYNIDTSQITLRSNYTNVEYAIIPKASDYIGYNVWGAQTYLCSHAQWSANASNWDSIDNIGKIYSGTERLNWWVGFTKGTGLSNIQTALTGSYIIYPLATPTTTEITNTTLIEQLESLYNAKSKDNITNIIVTSENLPAILNVSALKGDAE